MSNSTLLPNKRRGRPLPKPVEHMKRDELLTFLEAYQIPHDPSDSDESLAAIVLNNSLLSSSPVPRKRQRLTSDPLLESKTDQEEEKELSLVDRSNVRKRRLDEYPQQQHHKRRRTFQEHAVGDDQPQPTQDNHPSERVTDEKEVFSADSDSNLVGNEIPTAAQPSHSHVHPPPSPDIEPARSPSPQPAQSPPPSSDDLHADDEIDLYNLLQHEPVVAQHQDFSLLRRHNELRRRRNDWHPSSPVSFESALRRVERPPRPPPLQPQPQLRPQQRPCEWNAFFMRLKRIATDARRTAFEIICFLVYFVLFLSIVMLVVGLGMICVVMWIGLLIGIDLVSLMTVWYHPSAQTCLKAETSVTDPVFLLKVSAFGVLIFWWGLVVSRGHSVVLAPWLSGFNCVIGILGLVVYRELEPTCKKTMTGNVLLVNSILKLVASVNGGLIQIRRA